MGQKLGAFLRVLGGGLSPQAFAVQSQQFAAEEAAGRATEAKIEDVNIKQLLSTSSMLGKAYDTAKVANDTEKMKQIEIDQKALGDRAANIDPRYKPALHNAWLEGRMTAAKTTKAAPSEFTKLQDETDRLLKGPQTQRTKTRIAQNEARIKKMSTTTGTTEFDPSAFGEKRSQKILEDMKNAETSTIQGVNSLEDLSKKFADPNYVGGVTGDIISAVDSGRSQIERLAGEGQSLLGADGKINEEILSKALKGDNKFMSGFLKKAYIADSLEAQILELAYIKAKALDPTGKLSDADVRFASKMLGTTSRPEHRISMMREIQKRMVRQLNTSQKVLADYENQYGNRKTKLVPRALEMKDLTEWGKLEFEKKNNIVKIPIPKGSNFDQKEWDSMSASDQQLVFDEFMKSKK